MCDAGAAVRENCSTTGGLLRGFKVIRLNVKKQHKKKKKEKIYGITV